jgi:predicted O-methyltransferase YrrM
MNQNVRRPALYHNAITTAGFFSENEASLLIDSVAMAGEGALMLEVGSFMGRSTLFALSAISDSQRWIVVDSFQSAAAYTGHSFWQLDSALAGHATILPATFVEAYPHLRERRFDCVFIDADHSFRGFATDVALALALLRPKGLLLCHDVTEVFPGVALVVEALIRAGVLQEEVRVESLVRFRAALRPSWLVEPEPFRDGELP